MIKVNSSTIDSIGYDSSSAVLTVKFKNNSVYEYLDVPKYVYDSIMESDSVGKAVNSELKGAYDYRKID